MALLSSNRIAWLYTDDQGNVWRVAAQKALTDQNKLGGSAALGHEPQRPTDFVMRRVTVSNGAGQSRVLPCYEPTAPIVTAATTINANYRGDSAAFASNGGFIPERHPKANVTHQTT